MHARTACRLAGLRIGLNLILHIRLLVTGQTIVIGGKIPFRIVIHNAQQRVNGAFMAVRAAGIFIIYILQAADAAIDSHCKHIHRDPGCAYAHAGYRGINVPLYLCIYGKCIFRFYGTAINNSTYGIIHGIHVHADPDACQQCPGAGTDGIFYCKRIGRVHADRIRRKFTAHDPARYLRIDIVHRYTAGYAGAEHPHCSAYGRQRGFQPGTVRCADA